MTTRDYVKFADMLKTEINDCVKTSQPQLGSYAVEIANKIADIFQEDNPGFNRNAFFNHIEN